MFRTSLLFFIAAGCVDGHEVVVDDEPESVSESEQALLPNGGNVRLALVPYYFTDSPGAEIPRLTGGSGWDLQGLMFTGAGTDGATGSVKGFWSAVSTNRITVQGSIFPWIPVLTLTATNFDQRELWRPADDWYIPPDHQVLDFDCGNESWGTTPELTNKTKILLDHPDHPNLFLCRDPEKDINHFWARDGHAAYTANSPCPLGGTAQPPQVGKFYCIHRNLDMHANVVHSWALAGPGRLLPGITDTGAPETRAYVPADWQAANHMTLLGYPTRNPGVNISGQLSFMPLAKSDRPYALYNGIHEPGHALGLHHASTLQCTVAGNAVAFDRGAGSCAIQAEYGPGNFMGNPSTVFGDGYELLAVGAIAPANLMTIAVSGSYSLPPLASTPRVLRIATGQSANVLPGFAASPGPSYLYLDHRAATANTFDQTLPASFAGIELHVAPDYASEQARCGTVSGCTRSLLLDMHPETGNFDDATLKTGDSFTDRVAGITMQATLGTTPVVDVTFTPNVTKLILTPTAGGAGSTYEQGTSTMQLIQSLNGFSPWSIVTGTNNGGVLFYNAGLLWSAYLDSNGRYQSTGARSGTAANVAGWTHISPVGYGNLIFYNSTTGAFVIATMTATGGFTTKISGQWASGWTAVTGTLNGGVVWYRSSDGRLETGTIDNSGVVSDQRTNLPNLAAGFTKVVAVRADGVLLYNGVTGAVVTAQVDDMRNFTAKDTDTWNPGWTTIAGGIAGHLTLYKASDGSTFLVNVDAGYNTVWVGWATSPGAGLSITSAGGVILAPPPIPTAHVTYTGCVAGTPRFLIDWSTTGLVASYDVDIKRGSQAFQDLYTGTSTSVAFTGVANRVDQVRVRACHLNGCTDFRQLQFSSGCVPPP